MPPAATDLFPKRQGTHHMGLPGACARVQRHSLQDIPPRCPEELLEQMGEDVAATVDEQWASARRELGPCLVWRNGEPTIKGAGGVNGRIYDAAIGRSDAAHLVVWRRCFPDKTIPKGMTVDHLCSVTLCERPDHLQGPVTRAENTRRARQRARTPGGFPKTPGTAQCFRSGLIRGHRQADSAAQDAEPRRARHTAEPLS